MNREKILNHIQKKQFSSDAHKLHQELSDIILQSIEEQWSEDIAIPGKQAHYLSFEYLMGRMIFNNLMNLGLLNDVDKILAEQGIDIRILEDIEDAALGNGGLGRLAACFLDSAATMNFPLNGFGIRYKYGLFKQKFVNGYQKELPDDWQKYGDALTVRRDDICETVCDSFGEVTAVAYDMPVIGYNCKRIGLLRLWQAEGVGADAICEYLYPDDSTDEGKLLRIRQEYFLSSASIQNVIRRFVSEHGNDFCKFAEYNIFQLNDTHPVFAVLEFVRILITQYGSSLTDSLAIVKESFAYTNHTIMSEALECWDLSLVNKLLPELVEIAKQIDALAVLGFEKLLTPQEIEEARIIKDGRIHMARLAVYVCGSINGVAKIHSNIIKEDVFKTYYKLYPQRFQNKTNGITQRRWLKLNNPLLSEFITTKIGDTWIENLEEIKKFADVANSDKDIEAINDIKIRNKQRLCDIIKKREGVGIDVNTIFDIQIKRLHEYKRQLMNALSILFLYNGIKNGSIKGFHPTTYIFGAKSAGSYFRAKAIIKFINEIVKLINADEGISKIIRIVFVTNYNVSYAEHLVAAADVSEQISLAGTEASGTGNMKLMLSGAVTLGTMDGANIEIADYAGIENEYIFGMNKEEVIAAKATYNSKSLLEGDVEIKRVVDTLIDGTLDDNGSGCFADIYKALTQENDEYMVLRDLRSYIDAKLQISKDYRNRLAFGRKALRNIAGAGYFSSDRTISQYAKEIWDI